MICSIENYLTFASCHRSNYRDIYIERNRIFLSRRILSKERKGRVIRRSCVESIVFLPLLYLYRGHVKAAIGEKSSDPSRHEPLVKDPPPPSCARLLEAFAALITSVRDFNGVAMPITLCERLFRKYDIANIARGSGFSQLFTTRCVINIISLSLGFCQLIVNRYAGFPVLSSRCKV